MKALVQALGALERPGPGGEPGPSQQPFGCFLRGGFDEPGDLRPHRLPFRRQRLDDDRVDDQHDLVAVGVVRAKLRTLVGVEPALEQGAEDRGVDVRPVEFRRRQNVAHVRLFQRQGVSGIEEPAVEPLNPLEADYAAVLHRGEQGSRVRLEILWRVLAVFQQPPEHVVGQQRHVLGEHAEHQPVDEMGHRAPVMAPLAQPVGEVGEGRGRLFGQHLPRLGGLEPVGVGERSLENVPRRRVFQIVKREFVDLLDGVGPVGVDPEAVHVRDYQQRRVFQRQRVLLELGERLVQVLALALVFPGEAALAPDIGPALAAGGLGGALLEGEPLALGVGGDRVILAQQRAQVVEMGLRGGALLDFGGSPFLDEFSWRHVAIPPTPPGQ